MCLDLPGTHVSPITCTLLLTTQVGTKPVARLVPNSPTRMQEEILTAYYLSIRYVSCSPVVISPLFFQYYNT